MELQLPSLAAGALIAIVTAVAGRILWRAIEKALNGSADLVWFVSHHSAMEASDEFNGILFDLYGDARRQNTDWDEYSKFRSVLEYLRKAMISSAITIHNFGKASAESVTVLLSDDPQKIIVSPDVAIHKKALADGQFELMFDALRPSEQLRISFVGAGSYIVKRVACKGAVAENLSYSKLLPAEYLERRQRAVRRTFWNVVTTLAALVGIVSLLQAEMRRTNQNTADGAHESEQVEK